MTDVLSPPLFIFHKVEQKKKQICKFSKEERQPELRGSMYVYIYIDTYVHIHWRFHESEWR